MKELQYYFGLSNLIGDAAIILFFIKINNLLHRAQR